MAMAIAQNRSPKNSTVKLRFRFDRLEAVIQTQRRRDFAEKTYQPLPSLCEISMSLR